MENWKAHLMVTAMAIVNAVVLVQLKMSDGWAFAECCVFGVACGIWYVFVTGDGVES